MVETSLRRGSVLRMRSLTNYLNDQVSRFQVTFKAPKGKVFVAMLLGVEDTFATDKEELDLEKTMNDMGWVRKTELDPLIDEYVKISRLVGRQGSEEHSLYEDVKRALETKEKSK